METLLKVVGVWGVADALWIALDPAGWSRFWGGFIARTGRGGVLARALAAAELAFSLYLVLRTPTLRPERLPRAVRERLSRSVVGGRNRSWFDRLRVGGLLQCQTVDLAGARDTR